MSTLGKTEMIKQNLKINDNRERLKFLCLLIKGRGRSGLNCAYTDFHSRKARNYFI